MTFSIDLLVRERDVELRLGVARGETVAVLGPNGAGKSTLLDTIAGLLKPDRGQGRLGDGILFRLDDSDARAVWTPPHRRGVSLLAQDALLFPHLTVLENVAFGPRSRGATAASARATAAHWLAEVDAGELADRRPAELSGGQAQRIAVARALASDPGLLLLDEPMAALDVSVAPAVRRMLRRVLVDRTAIIVTHDILDAYTLADRVVIVEHGRITATGTPAEVFDRPQSRFTAGLAGLNLVGGVRRGDTLRTADAETLRGIVDTARPDTASNDAALHGMAVGDAAVDDAALHDGAPALLALHPSAVAVSRHPPADPGLVAIPGTVTDVEPRGDVVRVRSALLAADVTARLAADLDADVGSVLWFSYRPDDASIYPAQRPEDP